MSDRFRPDPAAYTGTYDTSECGGSDEKHAHVEGISAVFDIAAAQDMTFALRSMDPVDTAIPPNLVQTSPGLTVNRGDPDGDRKRVTAAAARAHDHLRDMGYEIDPVKGVASYADHSRSWRNQAASLGPAVVVEDDPNRDRSAG